MALCFWIGIFTGEERDAQKKYWIENSAELTVEAMMLDSQASDLDKEERPEVSETLFFDFTGDFIGSFS